jgi:hypothetical protein
MEPVYALFMKHEALRNLIRRKVESFRTMAQAAAKFDISAPYLSQLTRKKYPAPITDEIARKFGYTMKEREFEKIKEE